MNITFRLLKFKDLPMLYGWLISPHVIEWYVDAKDKTKEEIYDKYFIV